MAKGCVPQVYTAADLAGMRLSLQFDRRKNGYHLFEEDGSYHVGTDASEAVGTYSIVGDRLTTVLTIDGKPVKASFLIKIDDAHLTLCLEDGYVHDRLERV